jgi:hypothetical protein
LASPRLISRPLTRPSFDMSFLYHPDEPEKTEDFPRSPTPQVMPAGMNRGEPRSMWDSDTEDESTKPRESLKHLFLSMMAGESSWPKARSPDLANRGSGKSLLASAKGVARKWHDHKEGKQKRHTRKKIRIYGDGSGMI